MKIGGVILIDAEDLKKDYVDQATAAEMLKVSVSRISQLCKQGRFQGATKLGWSWIIPKATVENFEHLRRGRPKPPPLAYTTDIAIWKKALKEADNLKKK